MTLDSRLLSILACPKCGGSTFRSSKLPDGSVERECTGKMVDKLVVPLIKPNVPQVRTGPQSRRERHDAIRAESVEGMIGNAQLQTNVPTFTHVHSRACMMVWLAPDDFQYGVTDDDVAEEAKRRSTPQ